MSSLFGGSSSSKEFDEEIERKQREIYELENRKRQKEEEERRKENERDEKSSFEMAPVLIECLGGIEAFKPVEERHRRTVVQINVDYDYKTPDWLIMPDNFKHGESSKMAREAMSNMLRDVKKYREVQKFSPEYLAKLEKLSAAMPKNSDTFSFGRGSGFEHVEQAAICMLYKAFKLPIPKKEYVGGIRLC